MNPPKPKIFISYKRENKEIVFNICKILQAKGYILFVDHDINSGENFRDRILNELQQSSCVITFWSKDSVTSRWVIDEAEYAMSRGILIPVLLDSTLPPFGFGDIHAANLSHWDEQNDLSEIQKLLDAIKWVMENKEDSINNIKKGVNKILSPIPSKDYREFKEAQGDVNIMLTEVLKKLIDIQQETSNKQLIETEQHLNSVEEELEEFTAQQINLAKALQMVAYPFMVALIIFSTFALYLLHSIKTDIHALTQEVQSVAISIDYARGFLEDSSSETKNSK